MTLPLTESNQYYPKRGLDQDLWARWCWRNRPKSFSHAGEFFTDPTDPDYYSN